MPKHEKLPKDKLLPRLTLALFGKSRTVMIVWLVLVVFGALCYTTLLKREGFPSINVPIAVINGTYIESDAKKVDHDVTKRISDIALAQPKVQAVQAQSASNFFSVSVQYEEGVNVQAVVTDLQNEVAKRGDIPSSASVKYSPVYFGVTGGDTQKIDSTISFYRTGTTDGTEDLAKQATAAANYLNQHKPSLVENFFVASPFETAANPQTGKQQIVQKTFDRYGFRNHDTTTYYNSVIINVAAKKGADVIELDKQIKKLLGELHAQSAFRDYKTAVSASYAPQITESISELQRALLEGLAAVLVVGSIVIAIRASVITLLSMITVVLAVIGLLYLVGYSLNVITLFGLILGLSLIVDDTIIMVEALDASRRNAKTAREAVRTAVRKVSRAMVAATLTAVLSFAPLLFVGGILGSFIRAIPITIISALLISLLVALVFIPQFAKHLLLGKKQMGKGNVREIAAGVEAAIARAICRPMLWARGSTKKLLGVGLVAVLIGVLFIGSAGFIFKEVTFNLFPSSKDTNQLSVSLRYPKGVDIKSAQALADKADHLTANVIGKDFEQASYYGLANAQQAISMISITPYEHRDVNAHALISQLQKRFDQSAAFKNTDVKVAAVDVGPPTSAFTVQIQSENRTASYNLANDVAAYLSNTELVRASGEKARFTRVTVGNPSQYVRADGKLTVNVEGDFDGDDTSTLVTLAQDAVKQKFSSAKVASYGLDKNALAFNIGQESENQDSFKALLIAFPILLLAIYVLLAVEFRSLLQPLLIFLAIPFSLFGVTLGLFVTDNPFSFFVAMGFFALIGLSLKNTILLTDYANQSRRNGLGAIDSAVAALSERFRPLIATSLTAVVALVPLAISSPFWTGLAWALIAGLLSSTLLVILVFPYYYLGGEFLRTHISRKSFFAWLTATVMLAFGLSQISPNLIGVSVLITLVAAGVLSYRKKHHAK